MAAPRKDKYSKISKLKKGLVIVGLFFSLFGGMFAAIIAVEQYQNYIHPYTFTFIFGSVGLAIGFFMANLLKPHVILNKTMLLNYPLLTFQFSVGFIGLLLLIGHYVNTGISTLNKCDAFSVVGTEHIKGGYKRPEYNILYVQINYKTEKLLCSSDYWKGVSTGQKVNICIYSSPIGFDNLVLTDDPYK